MTRFLLLLLASSITCCNASTRISTTTFRRKHHRHSPDSHDLSAFIRRPSLHANKDEWKVVLHDIPKYQRQQQIQKQTSAEASFLNEVFNFKGFGLSFYKSFLNLWKCGIAFRIPILGNFDWWDRQPALPSFNIMVCLFFPLRVSVGFSWSMDMQAIKFAFARALAVLLFGLRQVGYQILKTCYILTSIFLFPIHGKWFEPKQHLKPCPLKFEQDKPNYKTDIQERLGSTLWYRWSVTKGIDRRLSYWHMYLPTLRACQQALLPGVEFPQWCNKHFASMGTDATITSASDLFLTGIFSLSGIHFPTARKQKRAIGNADDPAPIDVSFVAVQNALKLQQKRQRLYAVSRGGDLQLSDQEFLP